MPILDTQRGLRNARKPGFCYLCGESILKGEVINRDHVPPSAIFAIADRSPPLVLLTHERCNHAEKDYDEQISQLVAVLHQSPEAKRLNKLTLGAARVPGSAVPAGLLINFPFRRIVARWLKGFHTALYREPLPGASTGMRVFGPFPESDTPNQMDPPHEVHRHFVELIKKNRLSKTIDGLVCRNGKCRYDCVWTQMDDGRDTCVFALDLYGWSQLGDIHHGPERSCVGFYLPTNGTPTVASRATKLHFDFPNVRPLNAFEV